MSVRDSGGQMIYLTLTFWNNRKFKIQAVSKPSLRTSVFSILKGENGRAELLLFTQVGNNLLMSIRLVANAKHSHV